MGAFSSAMDALASFTGMVFMTGSDRFVPPISLKDRKLDLGSSASQAIKEFTTGMNMLQKHSTRLSTNASDIAAQNLTLLNNNLKSDPEYRQFISDLKSKPVETSTWGWVPFIESEEISAGFLFLQPGNSISPNNRGENVTLREDALLDPFGSSDKDNDFYHMYLNIFGSVSIESEYTHLQRKARFAFSRPTAYSRNTLLKQGDAFVEEFRTTRIKRLISDTGSCLLLGIHLQGQR